MRKGFRKVEFRYIYIFTSVIIRDINILYSFLDYFLFYFNYNSTYTYHRSSYKCICYNYLFPDAL